MAFWRPNQQSPQMSQASSRVCRPSSTPVSALSTVLDIFHQLVAGAIVLQLLLPGSFIAHMHPGLQVVSETLLF